MITAIIIIGIAFLWLRYETQWLTIRLECGETIEQFDRRVLKAIEDDWYKEQAEKEAQYQAWLAKRYEVKIRHPSLAKIPVDNDADYPQYDYLNKEEDLENRRQGNMLYQRGVKVYDR